MSLINQMLQDLEQRRAEGGVPAAQVRAVPRQESSNVMWRWAAPLLLLALAIGGGAYWFAAERTAKPLPSATPVALAKAPAAEPPPLAEAPQPSVLQLASELSRPPVQPESPPKGIGARPPEAPPSQAAAEKPGRPVADPAKPAQVPVVKAAATDVPAGEVAKDIKQVSPQQRAENAYRQAYGNLQQGRMGEAEENLRQALLHDPRHAAARQALAALLVESKRLDRAEQLLQQGLDQQPGHSGFAMTLARLQVERGDAAAALATLQRNPPSAESPDYHGFLAALLQRAERHKEAIEHYLAALRVNQNVGPWLLGLGISLQADNQAARAAEAFRRARQYGNLSPELQAFAEQRLKQLQ